MLLNLYTPDRLGEVRSIVDDSYPEIIERATRVFASARNKVRICGLPVCHIASRIVTQNLLNAGIAAYREEHPGHFITVMPESPQEAVGTDTIVCLTWAQWTTLYVRTATAEEMAARHTSIEEPGYIGTRLGIRGMMPDHNYATSYTPQSALSRAGAINLTRVTVPGDFEYEWDPSGSAYVTV